jgi:hypothetical protein
LLIVQLIGGAQREQDAAGKVPLVPWRVERVVNGLNARKAPSINLAGVGRGRSSASIGSQCASQANHHRGEARIRR